MSPPELAVSSLRVLMGEIETARDLLARLRDELARCAPAPNAEPSRERLALLAVDIHSWYTALESLLERILAAFEGTPSGDASHALLLRAAFRDIDGIRPAVLSPERREALDDIRRFRHFFRHAYALDLRYEKLRAPLEAALAVAAPVDADLASFAAHLQKLVEQIETGG